MKNKENDKTINSKIKLEENVITNESEVAEVFNNYFTYIASKLKEPIINSDFYFSWLGPELLSVAWSTGAQLIIFFCFRFSMVLFDRPGISIRHAAHYVCRVLVSASS